jgi:hypothetical protein
LSSCKNVLQKCANPRKNSFFNYESPALTAELQAHVITAVKHSKLLVTNSENIRDSSKEDRSRTSAGAALARARPDRSGALKPRDLANCVYPRQRCRALLNEGIELV